jgi:hypothetical protein
MPPVKPFKAVDPSLSGFKKSLKRFAERELAEQAIQDLLLDPLPGRFDFKKLKGYNNPNVYTITISSNHAFKMSFEIKDEVAILRRVGTHKQIDDNP